jgi:hypothetical protein
VPGNLKHFASPDFWLCYRDLPKNVQELADKSFNLLKNDPYHPSLHLKKIKNFWSVRIGLAYRALGVALPEGILWFWIGSHADYDNLLS